MTLERIELINSAKQQAGPTSQTLYLVPAYDGLLTDITGRFPILKNNIASGNTADEKAYASGGVPSGYRKDFENEQMYCNARKLKWLEPEEYYYLVETSDEIVPGMPSKYTVDIKNGKVYFWSTPDDAYPYKFYYTKYHPLSTGDDYIHLLGGEFDNLLIAGLTSKACELINPPQLEKSLFWLDKYERGLISRVINKVSKKPSARPSFWQSNW